MIGAVVAHEHRSARHSEDFDRHLRHAGSVGAGKCHVPFPETLEAEFAAREEVVADHQLHLGGGGGKFAVEIEPDCAAPAGINQNRSIVQAGIRFKSLLEIDYGVVPRPKALVKAQRDVFNPCSEATATNPQFRPKCLQCHPAPAVVAVGGLVIGKTEGHSTEGHSTEGHSTQGCRFGNSFYVDCDRCRGIRYTDLNGCRIHLGLVGVIKSNSLPRNLQRHRAVQLNLHSRIGQVVQSEVNRSGNLDHLLGNIQDDWIPASLDLKRSKGCAVIETELGKINHPIGNHVVAAGVDQNVRIGHRECDSTDSPNLKVSVDTRIDTIVATAVAAIRGGEEGQSKTDVRNR